MVELKLPEAVMSDPEPGEDAAAVTSPHLGPHTGRDRIRRARITAPITARVAAKHSWDLRNERQAAAERAGRSIGSPMTLLAGPWSQP